MSTSRSGLNVEPTASPEVAGWASRPAHITKENQMSATREIKTAWQDELQAAYDGSWYWIGGCGGDLQQWIDGYEKALTEAGIGTPIQWYRATGAEIDNFIGVQYGSRHAFPTDLTCLMFPLDGLNTGKLAIFRIEWQDRWFDDVVQNTRRHVAQEARA